MKVKLSLCLSNEALKTHGAVGIEMYVLLTSALVRGEC
jgi:hypothetical protein